MSLEIARSRTLDDLRAPASTWASEVKNYETLKRHVIDEGLVRGQQLHIKSGTFQAQERQYDPLLQRYRDTSVEATQRLAEEKARVAHLNRAADIQILREQPFHIIHHASKLEKLAPGKDPMRLGGHGTLGEKPRSSHGRPVNPPTMVDYNIVSNIPMTTHHWARSDERPLQKERSPETRKVPTFTVKDYNIINNKYTQNHEEKTRRDRDMSLLDASQKYVTKNVFDLVSGQFNDPRIEEKVRTIDHAREVEGNLRAEAVIPPSYKGRQTEHYGMISHEAKNADVLKLYDTLEKERTQRYRNRYVVEHNIHAQDVKGDHINEVRQLNRIAPERFEEAKLRGFDIIDNKAFGPGAKEKPFFESYPAQRKGPWDKVVESQRSAEVKSSSSKPMKEQRNANRNDGSDQGRTIRVTENPQAQQRYLQPSESAPQLRSSATSVRSGRSAASSVSRSISAAGLGYVPPRLNGTPAPVPPPAPSIPGYQAGSVYSQPTG